MDTFIWSVVAAMLCAVVAVIFFKGGHWIAMLIGLGFAAATVSFVVVAIRSVIAGVRNLGL